MLGIEPRVSVHAKQVLCHPATCLALRSLINRYKSGFYDTSCITKKEHTSSFLYFGLGKAYKDVICPFFLVLFLFLFVTTLKCFLLLLS